MSIRSLARGLRPNVVPDARDPGPHGSNVNPTAFDLLPIRATLYVSGHTQVNLLKRSLWAEDVHLAIAGVRPLT